MCFIKTLSEHTDPILQCTPETMGENTASVNCKNIDSDSDLEITRFILSTATCKTSKKANWYMPLKTKKWWSKFVQIWNPF